MRETLVKQLSKKILKLLSKQGGKQCCQLHLSQTAQEVAQLSLYRNPWNTIRSGTSSGRNFEVQSAGRRTHNIFLRCVVHTSFATSASCWLQPCIMPTLYIRPGLFIPSQYKKTHLIHTFLFCFLAHFKISLKSHMAIGWKQTFSTSCKTLHLNRGIFTFCVHPTYGSSGYRVYTLDLKPKYQIRKISESCCEEC